MPKKMLNRGSLRSASRVKREGGESSRESWTGASPETVEAWTWFQTGCGGNHAMGNISSIHRILE